MQFFLVSFAHEICILYYRMWPEAPRPVMQDTGDAGYGRCRKREKEDSGCGELSLSRNTGYIFLIE